MASTKRNGFNSKKWLPLWAMVSAETNGFQIGQLIYALRLLLFVFYFSLLSVSQMYRWYKKPVWSIFTFLIYIIHLIRVSFRLIIFPIIISNVLCFFLIFFSDISSLLTLSLLIRKLTTGICFHAEKSFCHVIVFVCLLHHSSSSWPFPSKLHMIFHSLMECKAHQYSVIFDIFVCFSSKKQLKWTKSKKPLMHTTVALIGILI